jgi:DNA-binding winged helix-turn-helix (wHTH) protein
MKGTMKIQFGECVLDADTRQVWRHEKEVHLSPKAFELLTLLVVNRPRALSKRELHEAIWPATFVTDDSLARLVTEIRTAIGDDARDARFVRTVYGFGYAFTDSTTEVRDAGPYRGPLKCWLTGEGRDFVLSEGENIIGRDPEARVRLDSSRISRRHARILVKDFEAMLEDLGSTNGTFLGGERVIATARLTPGDEIRVGPFVLRFQVTAPLPPTEAESA